MDSSTVISAPRLSSALRIVAGLLTGLIVLGAACGDSDSDNAATLDDPNATGSELVNQYLTIVKNQDSDGLRTFLSDAFIIQRADGSNSLKAPYVEGIADLELGEYTISDLTALQAGNALIVRWSLTVEEVIQGQRLSGEPAPRLSTFVYEDGDWRLSSHANFNVPES